MTDLLGDGALEVLKPGRMKHLVKKRVRFGHCDPAEIVYYPRYFEWFHDAFEAMFEPAVGRSYAELIRTYGIGYPAVQVVCDYRAPARWDDLIEIEIFLSRISQKSATFEYRVRKEDVLLATASVKVACMDMKTKKSAAMPTEIFDALKAYVHPDDEALPDTSRIR